MAFNPRTGRWDQDYTPVGSGNVNARSLTSLFGVTLPHEARVPYGTQGFMNFQPGNPATKQKYGDLLKGLPVGDDELTKRYGRDDFGQLDPFAKFVRDLGIDLNFQNEFGRPLTEDERKRILASSPFGTLGGMKGLSFFGGGEPAVSPATFGVASGRNNPVVPSIQPPGQTGDPKKGIGPIAAKDPFDSSGGSNPPDDDGGPEHFPGYQRYDGTTHTPGGTPPGSGYTAGDGIPAGSENLTPQQQDQLRDQRYARGAQNSGRGGSGYPGRQVYGGRARYDLPDFSEHEVFPTKGALDMVRFLDTAPLELAQMFDQIRQHGKFGDLGRKRIENQLFSYIDPVIAGIGDRVPELIGLTRASEAQQRSDATAGRIAAAGPGADDRAIARSDRNALAGDITRESERNLSLYSNAEDAIDRLTIGKGEFASGLLREDIDSQSSVGLRGLSDTTALMGQLLNSRYYDTSDPMTKSAQLQALLSEAGANFSGDQQFINAMNQGYSDTYQGNLALFMQYRDYLYGLDRDKKSGQLNEGDVFGSILKSAPYLLSFL